MKISSKISFHFDGSGANMGAIWSYLLSTTVLGGMKQKMISKINRKVKMFGYNLKKPLVQHD